MKAVIQYDCFGKVRRQKIADEEFCLHNKRGKACIEQIERFQSRIKTNTRSLDPISTDAAMLLLEIENDPIFESVMTIVDWALLKHVNPITKKRLGRTQLSVRSMVELIRSVRLGVLRMESVPMLSNGQLCLSDL
jgi:hypothetical protein